ncbi:hypothetical protein FTN76_00280 [Chlamydia trachomatis]|nr:hypothetical protein BW241_00280 [Chlamydia trachomatis]CCP51979.1 hypothetical protein L2B8200_00719 [Chlamydia trachomatis L2b/8200/07]CCP62727.1 hypothetical protein L1440_00723 [Chlamydia trachomatis L1/440/LN]CCP63616.1 hypothetical protein L11322_00720 [Chlamydia trachomatis L1/1322/p2]CCP64506.1 hypothetical protein L1115_00720 [Chlamydia trachomatis L1/115]CCP65395.1 hypothetical protein L1224_00720 [Chlamydia trachomatis L1/224]CCP68062.1 hypothetical protein L2BUCH2_00719 [Chlamy
MQSSFREILDFVGKRDRREIESKNKNFCKKNWTRPKSSPETRIVLLTLLTKINLPKFNKIIQLIRSGIVHLREQLSHRSSESQL